ncbi:hypothetical protein KMW28_07650 [Flammeovirga yaeyamensis]|uniref:Uncharacterized protein n=1 Tax=Flammeovirga yaeyamensis TaxID=367791 RepID=A0AAX1N7G2_9BACT|nr:hypothetical protein [Flammeovirga yaeyamensis]MBB3698056.1 hypothetical protein [Flammeovirga yaeyamensis]NMF35592.1 hypothetical protein [Flammeovirga yaeyamensis]QWG03450.1 hypothetical protein KMW28_07650 [Flammeovirga yaeyamensis]
MKLRLLDNSIRLRLNKEDIDELYREGEVYTTSQLGATSFVYGVKSIERGEMSAEMQGNKLQFLLTVDQIKEWVDTSTVGFSSVQENADGSSLKLLIEKDFKCLTDRDEDESKNFENPNSTC